jgi:DNA-binding NarL/FixJ family response regulator
VPSPGTIKVHVERLLAKLGVRNRTAASSILRNLGD